MPDKLREGAGIYITIIKEIDLIEQEIWRDQFQCLSDVFHDINLFIHYIFEFVTSINLNIFLPA